MALTKQRSPVDMRRQSLPDAFAVTVLSSINCHQFPRSKRAAWSSERTSSQPSPFGKREGGGDDPELALRAAPMRVNEH